MYHLQLDLDDKMDWLNVEHLQDTPLFHGENHPVNDSPDIIISRRRAADGACFHL